MTPREPEQGWWTPGRGLGAAIALAGVLLGARVLWHALFSGLTLAEDEAHYWLWSTRPDWGYYSKGPGTAWLIWASTALFGHTEWAVRLPAAASSALGMVGAALTARWALPREPLAPLLAAALYALVPGFAVASMLMTIDAPFLACWAWGGAFAVAALIKGRPRAWIGLGCCVGLGLLFKHTILLLPIGVWLGALALRDRPRAPIGVVLAAWGVAAAGLAPALVWNGVHDWATARHLLGHLGLPGGDSPGGGAGGWNPAWTAEMLGVQIPVLWGTPALAVIGWWRARRTGDADARRAARAMILIGLPIFVFYLLVSLRTRVEGNWAMAGAVTMTVPAAWSVLDAARARAAWIRWLWRATVFGGVLVIVAPSILGFLSTRRVFGPHIPIERVTGLREHAAAVRSLADRLRDETGLEPFVMTDHYGRASQLWFYLPGPIYAASARTGGRRSQFDLWADTDLSGDRASAELAGRPAVLIGARGQQWRGAFERIEPLGPLPGEPGSRTGALGYGFRGFGPTRADDRGDDDGQ